MFNPVKRVFTVLAALVFVFAFCAPATGASVAPDSPQVQKAITGAVNYLEKELQSPGYSGMLEWAMLGYYGIGKDAGHLSKLRETQITRGIMLSETKSTDYQRTVLGALAAGQNPDGYGGKNLLQSVIASQTPSGKFADTINGTGEKLVNAHVWGIIALHVAGQDIPQADRALQWLTAHQNADGGFSIDIRLDESDVDMTAMAIIAMACLGQDSSFPAVEKALVYLQEQQNEDGTFGAWGTSTAESCAQVVQALTILGIDPTAEAWSKGGGNAVTGLLQYRLADGSFSHGSERLPNDMASAQALIALGDYRAGESVYQRLGATGKTAFTDLPDGHFAYQAVNDLLARQVVGGYSDRTFRPDNPVTREEFVVMLARAKGLAPETGKRFADLPAGHWASGHVSAAASQGLVSGYPGNLFGTGKNITGAEVMAMITKAAGLSEQVAQAQTDTWYSGCVKVATEKGLIYPGFAALSPATRAQCAHSLNQFIQTGD
ncbi:MAG: hypothetical protein VR67_18650 [Peptococcaceae bacterium BRH_c8a]|nr:MAG: hypothetical protein VR67_18650 [Peptococcaceae bacterium BRH_c8a]